MLFLANNKLYFFFLKVFSKTKSILGIKSIPTRIFFCCSSNIDILLYILQIGYNKTKPTLKIWGCSKLCDGPPYPKFYNLLEPKSLIGQKYLLKSNHFKLSPLAWLNMLDRARSLIQICIKVCQRPCNPYLCLRNI